MLPLDIPERLVDAGDGAHQDGTAPVEAGPIEGAPDILDPHGVGANQIVAHLLYAGQNGGGLALDDGLAPAGKAVAGLHLHKPPAGPDQIGADIGNGHTYSSL